jgi:hypothetical protein
MTDHVLRRDEAAELLDAVNESMWKATDHARYPTAVLVALTQAVLEVGEQLRIANRLTIAIAAKDPIEITPETAAALGIKTQE